MPISQDQGSSDLTGHGVFRRQPVSQLMYIVLLTLQYQLARKQVGIKMVAPQPFCVISNRMVSEGNQDT